MTVFNILKCAIGLAVLLAAGPAYSQSFEQMSPGQLLSALKQNISELQDAERMVNDNSQVAEENRTEIKALRLEAQSLADRAADYDRRVVRHNQQAESYNERCQGKKLPEDVYTQCLEVSNNLAIHKADLDVDGAALEQDYAAYNVRVTALNDNEDRRVEAANQLLDRYKALDEAIRNIQVRLYDLSTQRDESGFSERVRQCTLLGQLNEVSNCMETVWGES